MCHSSRYVSVIAGDPLIKAVRFARYDLLLDSSSTFMIDSHYLRTIQIWQYLNEHYYYLISTPSVICQIDANCSERLKLIYYCLISIFSKYHFKTVTLCLLFLCSHLFIALGFDSNYFGILPLKIVKSRDHNQIKPPNEKYHENKNQSGII